MELLQSFTRVSHVVHLALQIMILYYAFPRWRRQKHRHWLFFCLSAFISLFIVVVYFAYPFARLPMSDMEIFFCCVTAASAISTIFAGFAIFWMVQHYRQPKAASDEH